MATRSDILALGKSRDWIDRDVAARRLSVIRPGLYRVIEMHDRLDVLRAAAVGLPHAVVTHQSAAHLLQFPNPPAWVPTVTVPPHTTHDYPGVTVRRANDLRPDHTIAINGLRATNVNRTVFDLAAILTPRRLGALLDELVLGGRLDLRRFDSFARTLCRRGKPGSAAIIEAIDERLRSGAPDGSALERLGLRVLRQEGLPDPVLEWPAPWSPDERIDAAYPEARFGIEWDSKKWHSSVAQFNTDRRRDRLAALEGWVVVRYTWADLTERPHEVGDEVRKLLEERTS